MKDVLDFILIITIGAALVIAGALGMVLLFYTSINFIGFNLDKSMCYAFVDNKNVYGGRCHFISISSIGENGGTKQLIIYKDKWKLRPLKTYVANDIEITEGTN